MSRTLLAWSMAALLVVATGCAMCASPYDYCGPTAGPNGPCCPTARSGSILSGGTGPVAYDGPVETSQPMQAPRPTKAAAPVKSSAAAKATGARKAALAARTPAASRTTPAARPAAAPKAAVATRTPARTTPVATNRAKQTESDFFPGIPRENILSITDRRLDEIEKKNDAPAVAQQQQPSEPKAKTSLSVAEPAPKAPVSAAESAVLPTGAAPTGAWVARDSAVVHP